MANSAEAHDVAIVGAGIAGSSLAAVLARGGLDVLVLEKSETFADRVRGEAIVQWGVKEAQNLGLYEALIASGGHQVGQMIGYDELFPAEVVESMPTDMAGFVPGVSGLLTIAHPQHCQALLDQAAAAGAIVRRGIQLLSLEGGAAPTLTYEAGGAEVTARARLIVGADGRPSAVREALDIPLKLEPPRTVLGGLLVDGADGWDADVWSLGSEKDFCFAVFPQSAGRARVYGFWSVEQRHRFAGVDAAGAFLSAFQLSCCPKSQAIASALAAGPMLAFINNETSAEMPYIEGGVLIGDAGGWSDPIIGCGLSSAYRDARIVSEILLASDDWSPAVFSPYAEERNERLRRLGFVGELTTALYCNFGEGGRARRLQFFERSQSEPGVMAHLFANLAGPESQPPEIYTPEHRAYVLGQA